VSPTLFAGRRKGATITTIRIMDGQPDAHSEPGDGDVRNIVAIRKNTARGSHTVKGRQDVEADISTTTYL
jgi:hypothetical protein